MSRLDFPRGFWWGTATSSHQVEGDNVANDWWRWEQLPGRIRDGTRSLDAAQWWRGRAEDDLALAAELGQNAHRLGLEWSRLEPERGHYDPKAFARYAQILEAARRQGLATMVTLNHFTLPQWLCAQGGWTSKGAVERFIAYARRCVQELGALVDRWATLNEPNVLAFMAYGGRRWPPGLGRLPAFGVALRHMLVAHARAYAACHEVDANASVGIVVNTPCFDPDRQIPPDRWATSGQRWAFDGALLEALASGRLWPPLGVRPTHRPFIARSLDWLGVNYYGRFRVRFDPTQPSSAFGRHVQQPTTATPWTDWGEPHADGLCRQLVRLSRFEVPLYVTENGIFDNEDRSRPEFLRDHVRAIHRAVDHGVDVRGYFHWSLIDNFEWAEGWSTHFGLVAIDRHSQRRTPRPSAAVYAKICRENALEDH